MQKLFPELPCHSQGIRPSLEVRKNLMQIRSKVQKICRIWFTTSRPKQRPQQSGNTPGIRDCVAVCHGQKGSLVCRRDQMKANGPVNPRRKRNVELLPQNRMNRRQALQETWAAFHSQRGAFSRFPVNKSQMISGRRDFKGTWQVTK
jgi:hypothetical protein